MRRLINYFIVSYIILFIWINNYFIATDKARKNLLHVFNVYL